MAIFFVMLVQKKSPEHYSGLHLLFCILSLQSPVRFLIEVEKAVVIKKCVLHLF